MFDQVTIGGYYCHSHVLLNEDHKSVLNLNRDIWLKKMILISACPDILQCVYNTAPWVGMNKRKITERKQIIWNCSYIGCVKGEELYTGILVIALAVFSCQRLVFSFWHSSFHFCYCVTFKALKLSVFNKHHRDASQGLTGEINSKVKI